MLPLFPTDAPLPAPLAQYDPALALPDFADRVARLRSWQQRIASGYVASQKEEALQAEFLNLVFGQALGYEHERTDYRQLLLEKKTNVDGTKPDGALGDFAADGKGALAGPVRVVVELKDARTLLDAKQKLGAKGRAETPVEQAFSYPSKMGASCRWVIVSNFVELRLYAANDQTRYERFQLDTLPDQPAALRRFFALLAAGQVLPLPTQPDAPLDQALRQRQEQEARISKEFYRDYRAARRALLDHLIEQNPAVAPLDLLGHTQKLLDRVIFVCFCEDKNIIPRKTFRRLLDAVRANVFDPADDKIYRTVRGLFQSIDLGNPAANINRFNGGLFAPDAALDALSIKDRTLEPVISLERYDFASELNVNILGHIFEQSLADLEAERARLLGEAPPTAKQGKRKQDGIFYTPDYITRYIVGQAVGGWLRERRQEAGLDALPALTEADRATIGVNQQTKRLLAPSTRVQKHLAAWEAYGQRLRAIRVLDPACGSGAFLNEAFGYLLREGQVVNDALAELRAGQRELFDLDRHILQHNLYGVDLNPESVQITRLSLWLQTANPGRPLTSLDHSIRCGNSLIADPAVAGDQAFDWEKQFPEVFESGGFDVVVGNPPYGATIQKPEQRYFVNKYKSAAYKLDSYALFIEKGISLLSKDSFLGVIVPYTWLSIQQHKKLRGLILDQNLLEIVDLPKKVFSDADLDTVICIIRNNTTTSSITVTGMIEQEFTSFARILISDIKQHPDLIINLRSTSADASLVSKIKNLSVPVRSIYEVSQGYIPYRRSDLIKNYGDEGNKIVDDRLWHSDSKLSEEYMQEIQGKDLGRYSNKESNQFIKYGKHVAGYVNPKFFVQPRLLVMEVTRGDRYKITSTYVEKSFANTPSIINVINKSGPQTSLLFLLSIINSSLISWYHTKVHPKANAETSIPKILVGDIKNLPIPNITLAEQQPFIALADELLAGHRALHAADAAFAALLRAELGLAVPLTGKLALGQEWKPWSTALQKALGRPLTLAEKGEWLPHYTQHQQQQAQRRQHLATRDAELDQLVYALYGLSETEIALVEGRETVTA
jgi:type I restriction-modification system DNA methylase subunit